MHLTASYKFPASVPEVWTLLMDPAAIEACLPGCHKLEAIGDDRYQTELLIGVGAVSGSFATSIALVEKMPPESYRLNLEATGRSGFARGSARLELLAENGGTVVIVTAHAEVGGVIARVGQRLLEGVARTTMDRFYECLAKRVTRA
jgi:uncharacterized protein